MYWHSEYLQSGLPSEEVGKFQETLTDLQVQLEGPVRNRNQSYEVTHCSDLSVPGNKVPQGRSITPPPSGVGSRVGRKRQNSWVGIRAV